MKTTIIALSAAILIAAAPAVLAKNASDKTPEDAQPASAAPSATIPRIRI